MAKHTLQILQRLHRKIFTVCLTIKGLISFPVCVFSFLLLPPCNVIRLVRNELQLKGESVRERSSNDGKLESSVAGIYLGTFIWQRIIKTEF